MKKTGVIMIVCCLTYSGSLQAQDPILEVIKAGVKKIIKAVDLKIQRMQNETIWLQHAQKEIENVLHASKLSEITEWTTKQKELYAKYFDELMQVKLILTQAGRVKEIISMQLQIVKEYKQAFALFKNDAHFSTDEILWMQSVYAGMLDQSLKQLDRLKMFITAQTLQLSDAQRMQAIEIIAGDMQTALQDLQTFNRQQRSLSLLRARDQNDITETKKMYGIQ